MKKTTISLFILLTFHLTATAQQGICLGDSVTLKTEAFRGELFWQYSTNGTDWTRLEGEQSEVFLLKPDEGGFYRYEVFEGTCNPVYSDAIEIIVYDLPVVSLQSIDSICANNGAFQLTTGSPAGGTYTGTGIIDGRFLPQMAGAGTHTYTYTISDEISGCSNSQTATIRVLPQADQADAGEDQPEIMQDYVQLGAAAVIVGTGHWSVVRGEGGEFSDPTDPEAWFFKGTSETYTLAWTVENHCGSSSDEVELVFLPITSNPCPDAPVVYDADGNIYPTVQIGEQCWMAKNLQVGVTVTSTVSSRPHSDMSDNGIIERYVFDNDESNLDLYGGYYDWDEMMGYSTEEGVQGICPEGWHIPTKDEWNQLKSFLKTDVGTKLKEGGETEFEGLLAGDRHNQGTFVSFGSSGFFWTSSTYTYNGANEGWIRELCACNNTLDEIHIHKKTGASVRCIKDSE